MHDFAITRTHVVVLRPARGVRSRPSRWPAPSRSAWKPENGARVGVLPRGGTRADVRWLDTELCYMFHPMNAYDDDDGTIVVDVPRPTVSTPTRRTSPIDGATPLQRWIDRLRRRDAVEQQTLDDTRQDFCRVNESLLGSRHRYGYTMESGLGVPYSGTRVFKHDFARGTREGTNSAPGRHPGEVRVRHRPGPRRDAKTAAGCSASCTTTPAMPPASSCSTRSASPARRSPSVHGPRRVPYGFHGNWVPYTS